MSLPLGEVLRDQCLAAAEPVVIAGGSLAEACGIPVSWVHTSEVLNIAELLRGGELLLVGGVVLAGASPTTRRRYLQDLAARSVAALAVETTESLPELPAEMRDEADRLGLPLIELRRVVRFVDVCRAINAQLAHFSVRQLQLSDRISHRLVEALGGGAELEELLAVLSDETSSDTDITSLQGGVIAAGTAREDRDGARVDDESWSAPITVTGLTIGTLTLRPHQGADPALLQAAVDKAPEALGLALLRHRPPSALDHHTHEFLTLALDGHVDSPRYAELAEQLGIAGSPHVGVVTTFPTTARPGPVDHALRRHDRRVLAQTRDRRHLALVELKAGDRTTRTEFVRELRATTLPPGARLVVGPLATELSGVGRSLAAAAEVHELPLTTNAPTALDATEFALERFLAVLDRPHVVAEFIHEQIGHLLAADGPDRPLLDTLSTYFRHWGRKTDTAHALHIQRQSLYKRLDAIFDLLGPTLSGSELAAVLVAVELETTRRRL